MKNILLTILLILIGSALAVAQTESAESVIGHGDSAHDSGDTAADDGEAATTASEIVPRKSFDGDTGPGKTEVAVSYSRESLTNDRGVWHEASLNVVHKFSQRKVVYGSYRETERFLLRDRQAMVGFYQPLDDKWTLLLEASASPTHRVLAKWSGMAQVERSLGRGWIAHAGFRRTELSEAKVNITKLGFEKYWDLNRAAYSLSLNNLQGLGTSPSQRVQYNRYYGREASAVGVSFAFGEEVEKIGPGNVLKSNIRNLSFSGKHYFDKNWGVDYGYTFHKQGNFYNRRGLRIGVRYKF